MKNFLAILILFVYHLSYSQNKIVKTSIFNSDGVSLFNILDKNTNKNSRGSDSTNYIFEIRKRVDSTYSCQIRNFSGSEYGIYNQNTLKDILLIFKINEQKEILILSNKDSISNKLKQDLIQKYGKDTIEFHEFFPWFYDPDLLLETTYLRYLNILKDYIESKVQKENKEIFIPNIADSMPANLNKFFKIKNDTIIITTEISTDSNRVKSYLYTEEIRENGESIKEVIKEKDMIYIPTIYKIKATGYKQKTNGVFLIKQIDFELLMNVGKPNHSLNIIQIKNID